MWRHHHDGVTQSEMRSLHCNLLSMQSRFQPTLPMIHMIVPRRPRFFAILVLLLSGSLIVTGSASAAPSLADSDARMRALWNQMRDRVQQIDKLLDSGRVGEGADGFLAAAPDMVLAPEESQILKEVNGLREKAYGQMAELLGDLDAAGAGVQRADRYNPKLKKGVFRELADKDGKKVWCDGFTDDERKASYRIDVLECPKGSILTKKSFQVKVRVVDFWGRPVKADPASKAPEKLVIETQPDISLQGAAEVEIQAGEASWRSLSIGDAAPSVALTIKASSPSSFLGAVSIAIPSFAVTEAPVDPIGIQKELDGYRTKLDVILKQPLSPGRNLDLDKLSDRLEKMLEKVKNAPNGKEFSTQIEDLRSQIRDSDPGDSNP